uniref:Uncharacterized protein n=1 Tax=Rhizophora mucronata TaxID=61149 RepID=A0A2P2P704_RHIMU
MVTWPLFGDQFYNEKLVVEVFRIGVAVGATSTIKWGEEEKIGVTVKREDVREAVDRLMNDGEEGKERRERAKDFSKLAMEALEEEGSSCLDLKQLLKYIAEQTS